VIRVGNDNILGPLYSEHAAPGRMRNSPERTFQRMDTQTNAQRNRATDAATEIHQCSAVKSPLGAQTVLGDRHDPICEILLQVQSAACGTRPRELSSGWIRKRIRGGSEKRSSENLIRQRGQWNDLNPGEFASRASLRSSAQHV
jgi:hypothetical protein